MSGRDLRWTDVKSAPHVVLVNQAFVRRFFPNGDPLGKRISELVGPELAGRRGRIGELRSGAARDPPRSFGIAARRIAAMTVR